MTPNQQALKLMTLKSITWAKFKRPVKNIHEKSYNLKTLFLIVFTITTFPFTRYIAAVYHFVQFTILEQ